PLVDALRENFSNYRLVVSTTTRTGQTLSKEIFRETADAIIYFPFDFRFSVRRALSNFKPSIVLLMETEIWPRFIREAKRSGAKVAVVNGRLSERSFNRYSALRAFLKPVLADIDLALMQGEHDAGRIRQLGIDARKIFVTGNLKFEQKPAAVDAELTAAFRHRFAFDKAEPLIIAASTHEREEKYILESLEGELGNSCRLMIAPRHPERFDEVAQLLCKFPYTWVRRSDPATINDRETDVILLDSIGELRSALPLAEIVFVGGSLIPHGGQNVIEPAVEGKAIVTGPYTANFDAVVKEFLENDAIRQTSAMPQDFQISERLYAQFVELLDSEEKRSLLGRNAAEVVNRANRDAVSKSIELLHALKT
ncbi:MAG: hypothetical protein LC734_05075, partial [Acidobacteria bacterium]|nr:hypothetical protein [Acidobacteriota bacterium]